MDYEISIITRNQIPSEIFLYDEYDKDDKDDFKYIQPNINISNDEQWMNERYQRDCIKNGLDKLAINNEDYIIISDLDEIPDPRTLNQIKLEMDSFKT